MDPGAAATLSEWIRALGARGVELWFEGDRLRFRAPRGALSPDERAALSARRGEVIQHLRAEASGCVRTFPLSYSQQSLWFLHAQAPESTAYHVAMTARVLSRLDTAALREALQALVDRHASLRTTYAFAEGAPSQRVVGAAPVAFEVHAVPGAGDAELREAVERDYRRPFDLERGPVLRASLYQRGAEDHVLLVTVHHIAADGWSLLTLFRELLQLHAEAAGGAAPGLARPALQYTDYASWQEQALAGPEGERLWSYWREKLAPPVPQLELPADRPRPATQTFRGASVPLRLSPDLTERIKTLARQEGTTPFVVLLACYQAFLYRLTGAEDVVVGTPTFARSKPEFMGVVGDFVNSVPLRGKLGAATSFRELVAQLRRTVLEALDAQEFPLPLLVRRLQPGRDPARSPLFDAFFALQRFDAFKDLEGLLAGDASAAPVVVDGLRLAAFPLDQQEGQFDLALQLVERGGVLHGVLKYATDLFEGATVRRLAAEWVALVEAAARDPGVALGALPGPARPGARAGEPAAALLERLRGQDVRVTLEGDRLRVNAPKGALTEDLKAAIAARRGELVEALRAAGGAPRATPRPIPRTPPLPVSPVQHRLWFLDRLAPGRSHLPLAVSARFRGPLDPDLLRRALEQLARRHESLRTRIGERDGGPELEILEAADVELERIDVSELPAAAREEEARRRTGERLRRPFDLARGRVAAYLLSRLAPDDHVLTVGLHPAVADRWSLVVAIRDLCRLYDALAAGRAPELAPLTLQHVDWSAWKREQLRSGELGPHLAHWTRELAGAPALLELPADRVRPAVQSFRGGRLSRCLDTELVEALRQVGRRHETTLHAVLLAAFQALLHRCSGQEDLVTGSPVANRDLPELEGVVGCFADDVAVRARLAGNPTFAELLAQVKRATLGALDHRDLPFDVLVESLRPERNAHHAPLFQVSFSLQPLAPDLAAPAGLTVELVDPPDAGGSRFDLALDLVERGGELRATWEYARDLFDEGTVARLHGHLGRLLRAAAADPATRVQDLPLLTPADEGLLLGEWNETSLEHDRSRCVHQLLEASARATPGAPAVVAGGVTLDYRALDERANRLARLLAARGVTPGSRVAVCVDRTEDMPVAVAAVLKAGAAYVPLDPTHPAERLRYTLEDAGVACAVTLARFAPLLAEARSPLVLLDEVGPELASLPATPPPVAVKPEDRAYVIYTSGSTGRPKGVEVEHRNVVSFLEAMRRAPGLGAEDVLLSVTTLSFDIAGLELWLPLSTGARVVLASRADVLDGERLMGLLDRHRITVMQATPSTWRLLLDAGWTGKPDLKALCGGEALPRDLAAALAPRVGELWNMYGPTETTIWSTVDRVEDPAGPLTIGRPIHGTRVYVLEASGQPAPIGVSGELCIAGEGVARGYLNRPELTREKFATIALPGGRTERAYRTGDVARFRADGRIEFLGRRDHQVKVRGYRIELGEIEAVLARHPGVKACVVSVREDAPGDRRLVGYVVEGGAPFDADAARAALRVELPEYMVPNVFLVLDALPLTPNGKVDRKALPAPAVSAGPARDDAAEALMTPAQRRVAGSWREVLRVDRIGLHDNFFDLGGHSLLLVKLHAALKREFASDLGLVELFQWTTVAAQAARLSGTAGSDGALRRAQDRAARQVDG